MAAKLTATQQKQAIIYRKDVQRKKLKAVLKSPFRHDWPKTEQDVDDFVISKLHSLMSSVDNTGINETARGNATSKKISPSLMLRKCLTIGVSSTTRALEKDALDLVVVNRSSPATLHRHILLMCVIRTCPGVAVTHLERSLSSCSGFSRLSVVGFKKCCNNLFVKEVMDAIVSKCPPINIDWLHAHDCMPATERVFASEIYDTTEQIRETSKPSHKGAECQGNDKNNALIQGKSVNKEEPDFRSLYVLKPIDSQSSGEVKAFRGDFISFDNHSSFSVKSLNSLNLGELGRASSSIIASSTCIEETKKNYTYVSSSMLATKQNESRKQNSMSKKRYYKKSQV